MRSSTTSDDLWGLVLAGGDGVRLQGLTRALTGAPIPKQYCRIVGDRSMFEGTVSRLKPLFQSAHIVAVVNRDHLPLADEQLRGFAPGNVFVQPRNCDTGPGLLFSLLRLARRNRQATVAVFPSDHYIRDDRAFLGHVARAVALIRRFPAKIALLGITPDRAEPGLGYIELGTPLADAAADDAFHVAGFVEKPAPEAAEHMIRRGALWNSFVMVFRLGTMISLLQRQRPVEYEAIRRLNAASYEAMTPWNFSRDFLTDIPEALIVLQVGDVGWSDWGTPEAVERTLRSLRLVPPWYPHDVAAAC